MHSLPVGSVLLLIVVDFAIVELLSVLIGVVVARAASRSVLMGLLIGVLLPVAGPLIWMLVLVSEDRSLAVVARSKSRGILVYGAAGLLTLAALLFLVATPIPWGSVDGSLQGYSMVGESSAADTGVGLFAMVGTALVLIAAVVGALTSAVRCRLAVVTGMVGAAWLLITVDGLILFSAADQLSRTVEGLSGGLAAAGATPGGGLYFSLAASLAALAGALAIAMSNHRQAVAVPSWTAPTHASLDAPPAYAPFPGGSAVPSAAPPRDEF